MQWLLLCVSLSAATALEFLCEAPYCTAHFDGSSGTTFELEGGNVEINHSSSGSLFVKCHGWNALESSSMPRFLTEIYTDQIYLSDCPLPQGNASISDTFKALNVTMTSVNGETFLHLFDFKLVDQLKPHHFSGFEFLTNLTIMTFEKYDPEISAGIFSKLSNLRSLTLFGIQIISGELNQLPQSLISLNLRGNSLKMLSSTFPEAVAEVSQAMPKLKILSLDASGYYYVDSEPTATNEIKVQDNQQNEASIEALTINRWLEKQLMPLQRNNRLRTLDIIQSRVEKLPDRFVAECPRLEGLSIRFSENITELPSKFLEGAKSLKRLEIKYSQIESLPDGFFQGAPNLRELNLSNNKLRHISNDIFIGLPLQVLNLQTNLLTEDALTAVASLTSLTDLNLRGNNINYSCDDSGYLDLRNLINLEILDLSNTKVDHICRDWRENLIHLKYLNLINTNIAQLKYDDLQYFRDPSIEAEVAIHHGVEIRFSEDDYKNALTTTTRGATVNFQEKTPSTPANSLKQLPNCGCSMHWLKKAMDDANYAVKVKGYTCKNTWKRKGLKTEEFCSDEPTHDL